MVIIGQSGSGKSVILKHMVGLFAARRRERVTVDGITISTPKFLTPVLSVVKWECSFKWGGTFDSMDTGENIAFALREHHPELSEEEIQKVVTEKLNSSIWFQNFVAKCPRNFLEACVKRVALARAIALSPEILLYDEPTTGLDPITSDVINDLILDMQRKLKMTSVVVTHDMVSAFKVADRIAMLYKGRIIEVGTVDEIKNTDNPFVRQFILGQRKIPTEE